MAKLDVAEVVEIKSGGPNKMKISRWLRPLIFPYDDDQPKATAVAIKHASGTGKLNDVQVMRVPPLDPDQRIDIAYAQFISEIELAISDDVEGTGGLQRYVLQALAVDKHVIARLPLRYQATRSEDEIGDNIDSEPATAQGLLAQAYRHNEALERTDKAGWGTLINVQARTIETLAEQNQKLMERSMDFLEAMEEVASKKHERDLEITREEGKMKIKENMGRQFTALLPAVAKKFGVDIGDSQHPDVIQFRSLIAGMTEEQVNALMAVLKPEQVIELLTIIKKQGDDDTSTELIKQE